MRQAWLTEWRARPEVRQRIKENKQRAVADGRMAQWRRNAKPATRAKKKALQQAWSKANAAHRQAYEKQRLERMKAERPAEYAAFVGRRRQRANAARAARLARLRAADPAKFSALKERERIKNAKRYDAIRGQSKPRRAQQPKQPRKVLTPAQRKEAQRLRNMAYRAANHERLRELNRKWRAENPDKTREYSRRALKRIKADPKRLAALRQRQNEYMRKHHAEIYARLKADPQRYAAFRERVRHWQRERLRKVYADPVLRAKHQAQQRAIQQRCNEKQRARDPRMAEAVLAELGKLVPRGMPLEIRGDLINDLYAALLAGETTRAQLPTVIRKYTAAAWRLLGETWRQQSLDEPIPGTEGLTRADVIADDHPHF